MTLKNKFEYEIITLFSLYFVQPWHKNIRNTDLKKKSKLFLPTQTICDNAISCDSDISWLLFLAIL